MLQEHYVDQLNVELEGLTEIVLGNPSITHVEQYKAIDTLVRWYGQLTSGLRHDGGDPWRLQDAIRTDKMNKS